MAPRMDCSCRNELVPVEFSNQEAAANTLLDRVGNLANAVEQSTPPLVLGASIHVATPAEVHVVDLDPAAG